MKSSGAPSTLEFIWLGLLIIVIFILLFGVWLPIFRKEGFETAKPFRSTHKGVETAKPFRSTLTERSSGANVASPAGVDRLRMVRAYIESRNEKKK
jgi:hypothetical protein